MSQKTTPTIVPNEQTGSESPKTVAPVEKKPNPIVRIARKVKSTPPKTVLTVAGGAALVVLGIAIGRNTADTHIAIVEDDFDPEPIVVFGDVVESSDPVTA